MLQSQFLALALSIPLLANSLALPTPTPGGTVSRPGSKSSPETWQDYRERQVQKQNECADAACRSHGKAAALSRSLAEGGSHGGSARAQGPGKEAVYREQQDLLRHQVELERKRAAQKEAEAHRYAHKATTTDLGGREMQQHDQIVEEAKMRKMQAKWSVTRIEGAKKARENRGRWGGPAGIMGGVGGAGGFAGGFGGGGGGA